MDDTKTCTKCGEPYPATPEFFYRDRSKKSGLRPLCKLCARATRKAYADLHKKPKPTRDFEEAGAAYRICDGCGLAKPLTDEFFPHEKLPSGNTFLRNRCKLCRNADCRERYPGYYEANGERIAAERKERYESDAVYRERITLSNARWRSSERGRELNRLRRARLYRENPEHHRKLGRVHASNRRAREAAVEGRHTKEDVERLYVVQRGLCWWCGVEVGQKFHVDHRIPIVRGGGSGPENLVITCAHCNLSKGSKLPYEFCGRLF